MYEKRIQILMDAYEKQGKRQADFMTDEDDEWVSSVLFYQEQMKNKEKDAEIERLRKELNEARIKQIAEPEQTPATRGSEEMGDSVLLETLTKQLDEIKSTLKEKDDEIKELNEMLTEAGETFQAKEKEIADLQQKLSEDKLHNEEEVAELERALVESKKALEMADQKIKSRDETLETTRKTLQGTRRLSSVSMKPNSKPSTTKSVVTFPFESPKRGFSLLRPGSTSEDMPVHNQVLKVVLTPVHKNYVAKHTKTSLLRLQNSPAKDPTRGRECVKNKENAVLLKKRQALEEEEASKSKRRKLGSSDVRDKLHVPTALSRKRKSATMGKRKSLAKYNLRVRK
uniref:Uncharacterized protein n=1 Tax=Magallana gigas TaxID=29159 RepID=A0A8W8K9Y8_MAGGI